MPRTGPRGRGVFASRDFAKGDRVLTVPYAACLGTGSRCGAGAARVPPSRRLPRGCLAWTLSPPARTTATWAPCLAALPPRSTHQPPDRGNARRWPNSRSARGSSRPPCASRTPRRRRPSPAARASRATRSAGEDGAPAAPIGEWSWALSCAAVAPSTHPRGRRIPAILLVPFVDMLNHVHEDPSSLDLRPRGRGRGAGGGGVGGGTAHLAAASSLSPTPPALLGRVRLCMGFLGGHNRWDGVELFKNLRAAAAVRRPGKSSGARRWWSGQGAGGGGRVRGAAGPGSNFDWDGADASAARW